MFSFLHRAAPNSYPKFGYMLLVFILKSTHSSVLILSKAWTINLAPDNSYPSSSWSTILNLIKNSLSFFIYSIDFERAFMPWYPILEPRESKINLSRFGNFSKAWANICIPVSVTVLEFNFRERARRKLRNKRDFEISASK